ncbi:MAG: hypothetical protein AB8B69_21155, partial [Chitinophagales bacterium]
MTSTIYKQISYTFLLVMLASFPSIAQNIEEGSRSEIITNHPIGEIYKSYSVNQDVVLLANTRTPQNLYTLLLIMDKDGQLKQEITIGQKADTYEHPITLCQNGNELYLLANRVQKGNKSLILYRLDANYETINEREIVTSDLEEGTAMIVKNEDRLWITAMVS